MDVVALKQAARDIRSVGRAGAQAADRRVLVAEGLEKGERKPGRIERLRRQGGDGFFDFDGVHFL